MNYVDILKECLQNPFSIENYRKFIVNFLKGTQLREITRLRSAEIFAEYNFYVEGFALIANYVDPKGKRVGIFAVKLKSGRDIEKARNKQRNFVARLIADNNLDAALAAFYLNEETKWRLSFVRLDYEFVKGKIKQNLTPAKRYSYLVGKDEPCHTAQEGLLPVFEAEDFRPTIDSIEQAFSVEKVTKQFFEKYKEKYLQLAEYLESTPCFVEEAQTRGFTTEQFAKKLMGQIVFMYFLQKKGWLGVKAVKQKITEREYKDLYFHNARTRQFTPQLYTPNDDGTYKLNPSALASLSDEDEMYIAMEIKGEAWGTGPRTFMRDLFNFAMKKKANFFDDYLEPLFYEGMNRQRDADNYYPRLHCRIPFLNGGLFEELGHYDWRNNAFHIPNEMFSNAHLKSDPREADGILDIFDRYNFTMNEDEPLEKEVAVDPEMLGKIFENLLDVTDRKSKGAFYTPREIVHYMCQESLVNYLMNTVGTPYDDTKDFVLYGDIMKDEDCSREGTYGVLPEMLMPDSIYQNLQAIDNALADVRIADPAVGSGAFPMGMLSEIVKLREIITEYMARDLCLRPEYRGPKNQSALKIAIRKLHNVQRNPYKLKKETMRNSIYAVDIEPSAVDIAKLRLWLSLVVEQEIDPNDPENDSPLTLPNLDCNVMCGNSLIDEFEGIDLGFDSFFFGDNGQGTIWSGGIDEDLERLFAAQKEYFYADNHDKKKKYADLIADIRARLLDHAFTSADAEKRARFDRASAEASTPFFLWKLNFAKVFKEKGGFDIVIGNPPYGVVYDISIKQIYENDFECFKRNNDTYVAFYQKAITLLAEKGILSFITPNTFLNGDYFKILRKHIKTLTRIAHIVDFKERAIFNDPTVFVAISIFCKERPSFPYSFKLETAVGAGFDVSEITINGNSEDSIKKEDLILSKIKKLCSSSIDTYFLVKDVGFNYWSEGKGKTRDGNSIGDRVLYNGFQDNPADMGYIKGRDFCRYSLPTINNYLRYNYRSLLNPNDTFRFSPELLSIAPKIIYRQTANCIIATIDEKGLLVDKTVHIIVPRMDSFYDIYLLLGQMNSKLFNYLYGNLSQETKGRAFSQVKTVYIKQLPLLWMEDKVAQKIISLVKNILQMASNDENVDEMALTIDRLIYEAYKLTPEEIALVESTVK